MPFYPVSGISAVGTGYFPTTGTPSGYSGPWAITTQELEIYYVRVPSWIDVSSSTGVMDPMSLSGVHTRESNVRITDLNVIVTAREGKHKDWNSYPTSSYLQLQKFSVLHDSDAFGDYYGWTSAFGSSALGPAGTILTTQPFIRRVPWTASDVEYTSSIILTNQYVYNYDQYGGSTVTFYPVNGGTLQFNSYKYGIPKSVAHTYLDDYEPTVQKSTGIYPLVGPYSVSAENAALVGDTITRIGQFIKYNLTNLVKPQIETGDYLYLGYGLVMFNQSASPSLPSYDPNRHNYT